MIYRVDLHVYSNATEGAHSSIEELVRVAPGRIRCHRNHRS